MNIFDKQRIESAIWTLNQYEYEIRQVAKDLEWHTWDCEKVFDILNDVKSHLNACIEDIK